MTTTIEKVRAAVADLGAIGDPPRDYQPLFYVAAKTSHNDAVAAGNYGLDSLDRVELAMTLEEDFEVQIPDDAVETFDTVATIAAWIDQQKEN
jgi:acyl carrier protein